jgi:hypothetical protein
MGTVEISTLHSHSMLRCHAGLPCRVTVPGHRAGSPCRVTVPGHRAGPPLHRSAIPRQPLPIPTPLPPELFSTSPPSSPTRNGGKGYYLENDSNFNILFLKGKTESEQCYAICCV